MDTPEEIADPMSEIRARVKELRGRKGWSAAELGERLMAQGLTWNRSVVANFESGRRPSVSLQELLALALVLDVAPIHLFVPRDNRLYRVTPERTEKANDVRAWARGQQPLSGVDELTYRGYVSIEEMREKVFQTYGLEEQARSVAHRQGTSVSAVLRQVADRLDERDDRKGDE